MTRFLGVAAVFFVFMAAMVFAAQNGGNRVSLELWVVSFYRVPVAFVAFGGLFVGMVLMLVAGIHIEPPLIANRLRTPFFTAVKRLSFTHFIRNTQKGDICREFVQIVTGRNTKYG